MRRGRITRLGTFAVLCVLGGVLAAGTAAPATIGAGLTSNRISDSIDVLSTDLLEAEVPLATTVTDRDGQTIATTYDQYRVPVTSEGSPIR